MNTYIPRLYVFFLFIFFIIAPVQGETDAVEIVPNFYKSKPRLPSPYTSPYGVEFITIFTSKGYSAIPVTQADGEIYSCIYNFTGKGKQLYVGDRDFPSLGKTGLHSDTELDNKKYITGRTIDLINYIARPGRFSYPGFIGKDEDIISVLKSDNQIVTKLGLKHSDLAKPLFHVWNAILGKYLSQRWVNNATIFYYDHKITINAEAGKGYQESIFHDEVEGKWNIQISRELSNSERNLIQRSFPELSMDKFNRLLKKMTSIQISEMNPFYIMRYGFYEGHTHFRADPIAISLIFGLRSLEEIIGIFNKNLFKVMGISETE